jgi:Ca2+-transporting ATPase
MKQKPRDSRESITDRRFVGILALSGVLSATLAFTVYVVVLQTHPPETARSWAFTVLVFEELLRAFSARSETQALWRMSPFSNPALVVVVLVSIGLQVLAQQSEAFGRFLQVVPMSLSDSALLLALAALPLCVLEVAKAVRRRRASRHIP